MVSASTQALVREHTPEPLVREDTVPPLPPSHERFSLPHVRPAVLVLSIAVGGVLFLLYPLGPRAAVASFMGIVLVAVAASDLAHRIIPNRIIVPALAIVLVARILFFPDRSLEFVLAAVVAGLAFLIPNLINPSLMGMGDVKLAAFLGAGLGVGAIGATLIAFVAVVPAAIGFLIREGLDGRKRTLPFGLFLAFGALVILALPPLLGSTGS